MEYDPSRLINSYGITFNTTESIHGFEFQGNDFFNLPWVKFQNKTFSSFRLSSLNLNIGIDFINCIFQESVTFENVICQGFDNIFSNDSVSISFRNCVFEKFVYFSGNETNIERGLQFYRCQLKGGIQFNEITIIKGNLVIERDCIINSQLDFNDCHIKQDISISDSEINTPVRFYRGRANSISLDRSIFRKNLQMWGVIIKYCLAFNKGEYEEISLKVIQGKRLSLKEGRFKGAFLVNYEDKSNSLKCGFQELFFYSCDFVNELSIMGSDDIGNKTTIVNKVDLIVSNKMSGDISFSSLHIGDVFLSGINSKATIKFDDIYINNLDIDKFYNHSQLILTGIKASPLCWFDYLSLEDTEDKIFAKQSLVNIYHSNLGKAQFYNFDFQSFYKIEIHNTILSEIIFSNVRWFDSSKLYIIYSKKPDKKSFERQKNLPLTKHHALSADYLSRKETFRQLKYACEKQGDKFKSLEFQRWESHYYKEYLKLAKDATLNDKIILWSNQTNNFGQSWKKATWIGLVFTFVFYMPIAILCSENLNQNIWASSLSDLGRNLEEIFWYQLPMYFQLINPTHQLQNIINCIGSKPKSIFIFDFIHRIVSAFFIFQIVTAFRKYVK